jgi:hypothetical protein
MRRLAAAIMLLLAAAGQGMTQGTAKGTTSPALPPGVSPEDAHAGCVHTDLRRCMISLGSAFWFEMDLVTRQIARRNETDVNGQPAHRRIAIEAKLPHGQAMFAIALTLASPPPNDEVVKVALNLPYDPDIAHTASEYDRTLLYDAVSIVLGSHCPSLDKMALYRFYENSLKPLEIPKVETRTDPRQGSPYYWARSTVDTAPVAFCGARFSVHRGADWQGPYFGPVRPDEKTIGQSILQGLLTIDIE